MLGISSSAWLTYVLGFFLLYPDFTCEELVNGQLVKIPKESKLFTEKCNPTYFCKNPNEIKWAVVKDSQESLSNWMTEWHLICESGFFIGLYGMIYFIGFVVGNMIIPPLSDNYGRKFIF